MRGAQGARSVALAGFMRGAMETELAHDELVVGIRVPKFSSRARFGYHKICRKTGEFAEAIGVVVDDPDRDVVRLVASTATRRADRAGGQGFQRRYGRLAASPDGSRPRLADTYEMNVRVAALQRAMREARAGMTTIELKVNGRPVRAEVTPRTHLADFLREQLLLTGTHIGCEHGICGACTVSIDGEIARSCITYAVACDGADIRTIESFDDDPLMARLRQAFSAEHALQCGYCTPGMLVAARDLIRRKGGLSRAEIRTEMSGNLCRCTGYVGIVSAIESVMAERASLVAELAPIASGWLGPAPGPKLGASIAKPPLLPPSISARQRCVPLRLGRLTPGRNRSRSRSAPSRIATAPPASRRASCCRIRSMPSGS